MGVSHLFQGMPTVVQILCEIWKYERRMGGDLTRFWDHWGASAREGKWEWTKREEEKSQNNLFLTVKFLGHTAYYEYYQNVTNDDIIKLYEKFQSDFLAFGYTLDGLINFKHWIIPSCSCVLTCSGFSIIIR